MIRTPLFRFSVALGLTAACAQPAAKAPTPPPAETASSPAPAKPKLGTFGVDLQGADTSTKPGDDFYEFAGGGWMKEHTIPADRSRWGMFDELREESDANVRALLDALSKTSPAEGTSAQKAADFYAAFLDTKAIEDKGFDPVRAHLTAIAEAKTLDDIVKLMGRPDMPVEAPIGMGVGFDAKDPDRYVVLIGQSGLGLPEREYYLKKEPQFEEIRGKYEAHIARVLAMVDDAKAAANAKAILALETKIAEAHWPIAERRERDKTYNPRTITELEKEAPKFPWKAYVAAQGFAEETPFVVREITAMPKLAGVFAATPVSTWRAYLTYHLLTASASVLPKQLDDEAFDFYGRTLSGQPEQRDRWKRGVSAVNGALGDAIGELYVEKHFQPKAKAEMDRLVENVRAAFRVRINALDWMTPETKKAALEKLEAFRPKIGYPAKWKDYSSLEVVQGDAFGNAVRSNAWQQEYMRSKLGKPTDRDEWFMTPQTVNAYYNAAFNEIVFPAAILQPPFFDPDADPAVNYGGIGGVIGHEMGHGFDDQGSKSDAKGVLRTWWGESDIEAFKKRTDSLADQYAEFEPLPGLKLNGRLTLGENIGDLGGLAIAHEAYKLSLGEQPAPVVDGYTGDQRFFLGWAQVWRTLSRDEALRNQVLTDPHSPAKYRVNGVVRNLDAWYDAFGVKEGDSLYLPPEKRVKIW